MKKSNKNYDDDDVFESQFLVRPHRRDSNNFASSSKSLKILTSIGLYYPKTFPICKKKDINQNYIKQIDLILNEHDEKIWTANNIVEELHYNLKSIKEENGLRKCENLARFLLHRIPIWRSSESAYKQPPDFILDLKDIVEEVKEQFINFPKEDIVAIVKEAASLLFETLRPKEKEFFNKNVRHLLKVRCT